MGKREVFLKIANWENYQHYKDRNPPWIKLYNSLLDDPDFNDLTDATRYHAVAIMLLASRLQNKIPYDSKWIRARIFSTSNTIDLDALLSIGFLAFYDDASDMLAHKCLQDASAETEREAETKKSREETDKASGRVFSHWMKTENLTRHKTLTPDMKAAINKRHLKGYSVEEIKGAITHYDELASNGGAPGYGRWSIGELMTSKYFDNLMDPNWKGFTGGGKRTLIETNVEASKNWLQKREDYEKE